jgi:flagellar motor switch protein FliM
MEALTQKRPLSAELIRGTARGTTDALALLAPFDEMLAERIASALSALGGVPVKASVEQAGIETLSPVQQSEPGFDLSSALGSMAFWFRADGSFDAMLCELCLGGTGDARAGEDVDRPPTDFERRLRNTVLGKFAAAAAAALAEISEQPDAVASPRARVAVRKIETDLPCHVIKILVNVFDVACDLTLHVALADCLKLAGAARSQPTPPAAGQVLESTPFSLEVFLKPDVVDVRHIINLAAGTVLKLNVAAASPVELKFNGQKIGLGLMGHDGERVRVRLINGGPADQDPRTVQNLLKLVNERVAEF